MSIEAGYVCLYIVENRKGEFLEKTRKTIKEALDDMKWLEENLGFARVAHFLLRPSFLERGLACAKKFCAGAMRKDEFFQKIELYAH